MPLGWLLMLHALAGVPLRLPRLQSRHTLRHRLGDDAPCWCAIASEAPPVRGVPQGFVQVNERGLRVGESHVLSKLSDAQVDELYAASAAGVSYQRLSERFGVSKSCVAGIVQGRRRGQAIARIKRV